MAPGCDAVVHQRPRSEAAQAASPATRSVCRMKGSPAGRAAEIAEKLDAVESDLLAAAFSAPAFAFAVWCILRTPRRRFWFTNEAVLDALNAIDSVKPDTKFPAGVTLDYNLSSILGLMYPPYIEQLGGKSALCSLLQSCYTGQSTCAELAGRAVGLSKRLNDLGQVIWPHALYRWFDRSGVLLYIGITDDVAVRHAAHLRRSSWSQFAAHSTVVRYRTRAILAEVEENRIRAEQPVFNRQYNDTEAARRRAVKYLIDADRLDLLQPAPISGVTPRRRRHKTSVQDRIGA